MQAFTAMLPRFRTGVPAMVGTLTVISARERGLPHESFIDGGTLYNLGVAHARLSHEFNHDTKWNSRNQGHRLCKRQPDNFLLKPDPT